MDMVPLSLKYTERYLINNVSKVFPQIQYVRVLLLMSQTIINELLQFILLEQRCSSELAYISFRQLNVITSYN